MTHASTSRKPNGTASDTLFRLLFEQLLDPAFIITPDGLILEGNSVFLGFFDRFAPDGCIGANVFEILATHPNLSQLSRDQMATFRKLVRTGKCVSIDYTLENTTFRCTGYVLRALDSTHSRLFVLCHDITERIAVEERCECIRTRLDFTLEKCHIGAWTMDLRTMAITGTPEYGRIFGYEPYHAEWNFERVLDHVVPEDRAFVETYSRGVIEHPTGWDKEFRIRRTDEEIRWIRDIGGVECDRDGKAIRLMGVIRDITDLKSNSQKIVELQEILLQSQKMDLLGQLAGGIAHDVNNVLAAIQGNAEMMLNQITRNHPFFRHLDSIVNSVNRSAEMVIQLLSFARKQHWSPKETVLDMELGQLSLMLRNVIRESIEMRWELECDDAVVHIDPANLVQIVTNLCINSRDAIPDKGSITIASKVLDASACEGLAVAAGGHTGRFARITIADNGVGIPEESLPHIYEPFFTTKEIGKGTGLGLAMVYGLVKKNNGYIACQSAPDMGTTFQLFFPVIQTCRKECIDPPKRTALKGRGTILLVEDEPDILAIIRSVLEQEGFDIVSADNGNDAVELFEQCADRIILVISDIVLPGMNGVQLSRVIRVKKPDMKFVFISGYSPDTVSRYGISRQESNLIAKPFRIDEFLRMVHGAINGDATPPVPNTTDTPVRPTIRAIVAGEPCRDHGER